VTADSSASTVAGGSVISLPKGGGAISGLGEKFSPNLFTGVGNFSVPLALPPGRFGVEPQLALAYSTGNGNGPFGLGWVLTIPGVSRKTSHGVPRYLDGDAIVSSGPPDTFILSGAEDLVPVPRAFPGRLRYRPRTEGLFARIEHVRDATGDYWEARSKQGMLTRYGTPRPPGIDADWLDPAATQGHGLASRIFAWKITETVDPMGNRIRYTYLRDRGADQGHTWDQPLIGRIDYADYGDPADPSFLISVEFDYEPRPDPFSDRRAGFEIRTTLRCRAIRVATQAADGVVRVVREYRLSYEQADFSAASLLTRVDVVGIDDQGADRLEEQLPPLTLGYSGFDPTQRRFAPVGGPGLPGVALSDPNLSLVDLRGTGMPDIVELGAVQRYWSNRGDGRFDLPRSMTDAPPYTLGEPGVRFLDADGDGRADLTVLSGGQAGYFPVTFAGGWSRRGFQPYRQVPSVSLADPGMKMVDLDGDGLTDLVRSGTRLECWFNDSDPRVAWQRTATAVGLPADLDLADPRVQVADMTGDGLQDMVEVRNGNIAYWPNLGHGRWGAPVQMRRAPRFPQRYDPRRVLFGDVDGDGAADVVYIDDGQVLVWGNQSGNSWTEQPVMIGGTPGVVDTDAVQLADLHGSGMGGLLWSRDADGSGRPHLHFLDFTSGNKPHLLSSMDNNLGALTTVHYRPSTYFFLRDDADPATRWRTSLPFPVYVVARVEVTDQISLGRLVTDYRYHHGYWDGAEREFRGFAMVEQFDIQTEGAPVAEAPDAGASVRHAPPTMTRSWFHVGPVAADEAGDWTELDLRHEYWDGDAQMLARPPAMVSLLGGLPRRGRRDALRALRGQLLRSELYALDGTDRQARPYTVTESLYGVREESPAPPGHLDRPRIFFAFGLGHRSTQWERGNDPMTQLAFTAGYDAYGCASQQLAVAIPRQRDPLATDPVAAQPYLATSVTTEYVQHDEDNRYLVDRVSRVTSYEVLNDGRQSVFDLRDSVLDRPFVPSEHVTLRVIGHIRTRYDGEAFTGLPLGELGEHGLPVRVESLAFTDSYLDGLFNGFGTDPEDISPRPVYLDPGRSGWTGEYPEEFRALTPALAGYVHYRDGEIPGSPGGYYVISARHSYDIHENTAAPRGLPVASLDPLGGESRIEYDHHDLLPVRAVDPAGLAVHAEYDYRLLLARELTDANGNPASVTFSPAGFVVSQFVRGKNGEGDATAPGARMEYDLLAFARHRKPASVRSTRRVFHDTQVEIPVTQRDEVIASIEYSDGFGRVLQTRTQAQRTLFGDPVFGGGVIPADPSAPDGPALGRTQRPGDPENVVVSGWQIYDNKGQVVEKYEPFFSTGWDYAEPAEAERGQRVTIFYDPRGHAVRTVSPDHSEQRVIFGIPVNLADPDVYRPTPWESFIYDANDNAGRTHGTVAEVYRGHWNTPASIEVDALGRTVVAVARDGPDPSADWYVTRSAHDIQGNPVSITDSLGREAFRYTFDLARRRWRMNSIDAGRRDNVPDAIGNPVEGRDSKGAMTLGAFDLLHRPIRVWARDDTDGPMTLRQRLEYGDGGDPDQPAAAREAAKGSNLLGRPTAHYDEAGLITVTDVDFKGNVLESARRVIADMPILATFEQAASENWQVRPFQVDWQAAAAEGRADHEASLLDTATYQTSIRYDALNRILRHLFPRDVEGRRRELRPAYNAASGLERLQLDDTVFIERIYYDAKGQRALVALGNGIMTRYAHNPHTFRLTRLRSEHYALLDTTTYRAGGEVLQDHTYDHDLVGNILAIRDRTPGSGILNNPDASATTDPALGQLLASGDALDRRFTYDPIYRLLSATGRECDAPPPEDQWHDVPRCNDITRTRPYTETYQYDAVGNMLQLTHAADSGFTRSFTVEAGSNRLHSMHIGAQSCDYEYDPNGNMRAETTSRHYEWNHVDQLKAFTTQTAGAEPSVHAQYLYDATGQRVKKLVRRQGGDIEVTHYINETFEHHRWEGGTAGETNHVHVRDDHQRIALVRVGQAQTDDPSPSVAIHVSDHLGSTTAITDASGALTSREEFTPYGETSFGSHSRKRYRFTGQERDEGTSLCYHAKRYYLPWLGRWASCEPRSPNQPQNLYVYVNDNPIRLVDGTGLDGTEPRFNAIVGISLSWGSLDQHVGAFAAVTGQLPLAAFGVEAGARLDVQVFRRIMGVSEVGAVAATSYFGGASIGEWNTSAAKLTQINHSTLDFPGSGMVSSDQRASVGWGRTDFFDLKISTGASILAGGGIKGLSLRQGVGTVYLRGDVNDQSIRFTLGNDTTKTGGSGTDWWETMSVRLSGSALLNGRTREFAVGIRATTDPIVLINGVRQVNPPQAGAPRGRYETYPVGANHFIAYFKLSALDPGGSLSSLSIGSGDARIQYVQDWIHDRIGAPYFKHEAPSELFYQAEASGVSQRSTGGH
jgi:RHS repeat-associated protein